MIRDDAGWWWRLAQQPRVERQAARRRSGRHGLVAAMVDIPLRGHRGHNWFYKEGEDHTVYPPEILLKKYLVSCSAATRTSSSAR